MTKTQYRSNFHLQTILFILLCVSFPAVFSQSTVSDVIKTREHLFAQLDSLDLEKQILKRNGKSLETLEVLSVKIHDSLSVLRNAVSEADMELVQDASISALVKKGPQNLFDWLIIIVGFIAIISGMVLIGALLHTLLSKKNKKNIPTKSISQIHKKVNDNFLSNSNDTAKKRPVVASETFDKKSNNADIESIRNRFQSESRNIRENTSSSNPLLNRKKLDSDNSQSPVDIIANNLPKDGFELKQQLIDDAKNGATIQEMSRKFQISVDQISLMLKVADKDSSGL